MRAVIMAGGLGSRLAPYTTVLPKPLMPLSDRPILGVVLNQLERAGVEAVTISVGHMGSLIESWVRHQPADLAIDFLYEDEPLGTAGSLANIARPDETFLAMNGDILTDLSFAALVAGNDAAATIATMAVKQRQVDIQYGVVHSRPDGLVARLEEKPQLSYTVSMGVYAMRPDIIDLIGPGERVDFPDLIARAMGAGHDVRTHTHGGYWRDIGNRDDYEAAIEDFVDDRARFMGPGDAGP